MLVFLSGVTCGPVVDFFAAVVSSERVWGRGEDMFCFNFLLTAEISTSAFVGYF